MTTTTKLSKKMLERMKPIVADLERGLDVRTVTMNHEMSLSRLRSNLREMGKEELIGLRKNSRKPETLTGTELKVISEKYFTGTSIRELAKTHDVTVQVVRMQLAANLPDVWVGV